MLVEETIVEFVPLTRVTCLVDLSLVEPSGAQAPSQFGLSTALRLQRLVDSDSTEIFAILGEMRKILTFVPVS